MNGQLHFDGREDHDDPALRVLDQFVGRDPDTDRGALVTVYGDGSMTCAVRSSLHDEWCRPFELRSGWSS